MKANRVTLITLGVADIARARAFYEALGWEPEEVMDQVVFYDMGGLKFGFFHLDGMAEEQGRPRDTLRTGAQALSQNFASDAEVDAMFARAVQAGATPLTKPFKTSWGGYSSYVTDPDGHVWEFAHNPFWPLDEDGRLA